MPIVDAKKNTIIFMPYEMFELCLLKEGRSVKPTELAEAMGFELEKVSRGQEYDFKEVRQFAFTLMEKLMISFRPIETTRKLESFSEEERVKIRPFAWFLAMLDGNAFNDLIDQYIPEAYTLITGNGINNLDDQLANMKLS